MPDAPAPKFRRRKDARPGEILEAALAVFAEKGFAGARIDDIAARAGVSKGAIYLYFATKQEIFQAAVEDAAARNIAPLAAMARDAHGLTFAQQLDAFADRFAHIVGTPLAGVAKMVIAEARNFPELAKVWHDTVVSRALGALTALIAQAQARGELRPADPRHVAVSFLSPLVVAILWRETFVPVGAQPFDIAALARQHIDSLLNGLKTEDAR